ncbi:hypothetical protein SDC9_20241 [bioreactor metagenome]|uniref:Uncharacterized protein n=1 Tax=bioreactor metagenome TaxID=1076179 RepID=A0A644U615_9ZZZZ
MNSVDSIVLLMGICLITLALTCFMSTKKSRIRRELREALDNCWFVSDSEKDRSAELVKITFPRAKFAFKTDWQGTQENTITYAKVKSIINQ